MSYYKIKAINFLLKYAEKWHSYNNDVVTTETIGELVSLRIAKINDNHQFKLISHDEATKFLSMHSDN